jgi:hypothetical protein
MAEQSVGHLVALSAQGIDGAGEIDGSDANDAIRLAMLAAELAESRQRAS